MASFAGLPPRTLRLIQLSAAQTVAATMPNDGTEAAAQPVLVEVHNDMPTELTFFSGRTTSCRCPSSFSATEEHGWILRECVRPYGRNHHALWADLPAATMAMGGG